MSDPAPNRNRDNLKECRGCRMRQPIRNFPTKYSVLCIRCKRDQLARNRILVDVRAVPGAPLPPDHRSPEYANKLARERARAIALTKPQREYKNPSPSRFCVRCKFWFPMERMARPRARLCARCDKLTLVSRNPT